MAAFGTAAALAATALPPAALAATALGPVLGATLTSAPFLFKILAGVFAPRTFFS